MNKKHLFILLLLFSAGAAAWPRRAAQIPGDLRDAPAALDELSGGAGHSAAPDIASPPAVPAPAPSSEASAPGGAGKWTGWLQGRSDYGYLPGTRNISSGSSGFKVYYRCSAFREEADNRFSMRMQFANDKGGDLGIVTWTRGPLEENFLTVTF